MAKHDSSVGVNQSSNRLLEGLLLVLIFLGVALRFYRLDWNQGTNLHPDEYGLTNTLTQLKLPASLERYFNTRISPLSPYTRYDAAGRPTGDGPDNRMRWGQWPIILLRAAAELTGNTGYGELRLTGRGFSALADVLTLLVLYLIGRRLYNPITGLLAAALSALAVLQIQQSHFMTVDSFAVCFTALAMYAAVRVAQRPLLYRQPNLALYRLDWAVMGWYALFGVFFGMAVASKINLLPLGGMIAVAAFIGIADLKLGSRRDLHRIFGAAVAGLVVAVLAAGFTFRLTQPMSFRAESGDTTLFTLRPNPDWLDSMRVAQNESNGIGGGPPAEQWTARAAILFPLMNLVVWGMGLPLGLAGWAGWLGAAWQRNWRVHLLPLVWTGGYFLFMGTRWVKSIRYFLPIYPFLCLLAAWGLLWLWQRPTSVRVEHLRRGRAVRAWIFRLPLVAVILGTLAWAVSFSAAVYGADHTRIQATRWIYENIPGPFHLTLQADDGRKIYEPVAAPDRLVVSRDLPYIQAFTVAGGGKLASVDIPHVAAASLLGAATSSCGAARLQVAVAADEEGRVILDQVELLVKPVEVSSLGDPARAEFHSPQLEAGRTYYLVASTADEGVSVILSRSVIATESWDEGLPLPFDGRDPYGQLYSGVRMEVRWADSEDKRAMFLESLAQADVIILPSQRAVWSSCRLPRTYPMTMAYYRALFDGQLGFERAATFQAPLRLGPLFISDLAGSLAWGRAPDLPVFNNRPLAAEEAFSVYDHPPVWIFRKTLEFNLAAAQAVLESVDLSQVVIQSPREADGPPCGE